MFNYELEVKIDSREELPSVDPKNGEWTTEDVYQYRDLYYGFKVKDTGCAPMSSKFDDRVFTMAGTSTLEELKTMFTKLTDEIISSDTPPKMFKASIALLRALLSNQDEKEFSDNLEYEVSRNWPNGGVRLYLHKTPAPISTEPKADGCVTGSLWKVGLKLRNKQTRGMMASHDHIVFCVKPESAVREVLDKLFRSYPDLLEQFDITTPIQVTKLSDTKRFPYAVISDKDKA